MPRDLPIGNGSLLVAFDSDYQIRDIYFPWVGKENHTSGHPFRLGVWVEGRFAWMGPEWERDLRYLPETLVTDVTATHHGLALRLRCQDGVDFHENILVRQIRVENLADREREVRLFFSHDFHISDHPVGDTAAYDPRTLTVTHYKDERHFLFNCCTPYTCGVQQFATGTKEHRGQEGTWRDAEDGHLEGNPIAQGTVDSTIALHITVPAGGTREVFYWMIAGRSRAEVRDLNAVVIQKTPAVLLHRTADYWRLWVNKEMQDFAAVPGPLVDLYKRSLLVLRTQIDNGGAIIAANDSDIVQFGRDTYSYCWPRDGALVAHALDLAGFPDVSQRFFAFCGRIIERDGYFLHKYNPNGSLGSSWHPWIKAGREQLPIQEDETALVLWALWEHFRRYRDVEFIKPLYRPLIKSAGEFLVAYRDPTTGLPQPSYDLWEERQGVLTFTTAAVYGGLKAAARFTDAFGEVSLAARFEKAAAEVRAGMDAVLFRPEAGRFARMVAPDGSGALVPDLTLDASLYGTFTFGAYPPGDARVAATMRAIRERLWVKTEVGGVARYENDYYHQVSQDIQNVPGNPWFICTLWLAQYAIAAATDLRSLQEALPVLEWVASRALPSGVLAEQVHPYSGAPLSVSPLTWSHATFVTAVAEYLERHASLRAR